LIEFKSLDLLKVQIAPYPVVEVVEALLQFLPI
jgi:hypothetical protein